jgi:hypothetical protein
VTAQPLSTFLIFAEEELLVLTTWVVQTQDD